MAVVDVSIIESIGAPMRKAMDVEGDGEVTPAPASKDKDAKRVKKAGRFYLGYKLYASSDEIKAKRWVIEQTFGTLKRRFGFSQATYFGQNKVLGQCYLKAMCLNLLKASNKVSHV